ASADQTVMLWDMENKQAPIVLRGHTAAVYSVAFSPDGEYLATGSADKTAKFWDVASGKLNFTLRGHTDTVTYVAFSPKGNRLATASYDSTTKLWNVPLGRGAKAHYSRRQAKGEGTFATMSPDLRQAEDWDSQEPVTFKGH